MKLIFNDASEMVVQTADVGNCTLTCRIIAMTREEILAFAKDKELTSRVQVVDGRDSVTILENYKFGSLTEYEGAMYELQLVQEGKSTTERLENVEQLAEDSVSNITDIQLALAELYETLEV